MELRSGRDYAFCETRGHRERRSGVSVKTRVSVGLRFAARRCETRVIHVTSIYNSALNVITVYSADPIMSIRSVIVSLPDVDTWCAVSQGEE